MSYVSDTGQSLPTKAEGTDLLQVLKFTEFGCGETFAQETKIFHLYMCA